MEFEFGPSGERIEKAYVAPMSVTNMPGLVPVTYPVPQSWFGKVGEFFPGSWQRNIVPESLENILAFTAVDSCITLISNDGSTLRPMLMRESDDDVWDEVRKDSPFLPVLRKPNHYQTRIQFLQYWIVSKLIYGNAYILIERDRRGIPVALYPLDPRRVRALVSPNGDVYYDLGADTLNQVDGPIRVPASEIIHDRMKTTWHPLCGMSAIQACAAAATQGLRIQNNSEQFFSNMSRPSGMLTAPGLIPQETADRLKATFESNFGGSNLGRLFVGGDGLAYNPLTIPANDAQLIEQQKWTVESVASCFLVPLHKICAAPIPSQPNIGASNQQYYNDALKIHIESIERLLTEAFRLDDLGMEVWLDTSEMLRMDPLLRAEMNAKAIGAGYLAPNESRVSENYHPVEGGEIPYIQQQNWPLNRLAALHDMALQPQPAPAMTEPEEEPEENEDKEMVLAWMVEKALRSELGAH